MARSQRSAGLGICFTPWPTIVVPANHRVRLLPARWQALGPIATEPCGFERRRPSCQNERPRRMGPCVRRDDQEFSRTTRVQPPAFSLALKRTSSSSEEDTEGTCSPSEAFEIATRVLLKTVSSAVCPLRLLSSSDISTEYWPLPSSVTLPGVAEDRISALSGAVIGAS